MADETSGGIQRSDSERDKGKQPAERIQTFPTEMTSSPADLAGRRMRQILHNGICVSTETRESSGSSEQNTTLPPMHTRLYHEIKSNFNEAVHDRPSNCTSLHLTPSRQRTKHSTASLQPSLRHVRLRPRHSLRQIFQRQAATSTKSDDVTPTRALPAAHARLMEKFPVFSDRGGHTTSAISPYHNPQTTNRPTARSAAAITQTASMSKLRLQIHSASTLVIGDASNRISGVRHRTAQTEQADTQQRQAQIQSEQSKSSDYSSAPRTTDTFDESGLAGVCVHSDRMTILILSYRRQAMVALSSLQVQAF